MKLVERYLPDPFIFVLLLTLVAAAAAIGVERQTPLAVLRFWGDGFWNLLTFSMQMLLVLVTGFMLASSPPVKRQLARLAGQAGTPARAIVLVTLVSLAASWINWGFGLVVGALFAKELARQIRVDYRLLVASAYSGFVVWHGGLAGSIPLVIATEGHFTADRIGVIAHLGDDLLAVQPGDRHRPVHRGAAGQSLDAARRTRRASTSSPTSSPTTDRTGAWPRAPPSISRTASAWPGWWAFRGSCSCSIISCCAAAVSI